MKKKLALVLGAALVAQSAFALSASAAYYSGNDINLKLSSPLLGGSLGSLGTGQTTFQLQEDVHQALTETTGAEVDHFYVNVYVNDAHVIAVDPPLPMY